MCEFNVILNDKSILKDVIYAKAENGKVTLRNVLGEAKEIQNCSITEVDVNNAKMTLTSINS